MTDRRSGTRIRSFLRGTISSGDGGGTQDCVVLDIGAGGARIKVPEDVTLPDRFELHILQQGTTYDVSTQWRVGSEAGIAFHRIDGEDVTQATGMPSDFPRRLLQLEETVAQLRGLTLDMAAQLDQLKRSVMLARAS